MIVKKIISKKALLDVKRRVFAKLPSDIEAAAQQRRFIEHEFQGRVRDAVNGWSILRGFSDETMANVKKATARFDDSKASAVDNRDIDTARSILEDGVYRAVFAELYDETAEVAADVAAHDTGATS